MTENPNEQPAVAWAHSLFPHEQEESPIPGPNLGTNGAGAQMHKLPKASLMTALSPLVL